MKKTTRNALIAAGIVFGIYMLVPFIRGLLTALVTVLGFLAALIGYCLVRILRSK